MNRSGRKTRALPEYDPVGLAGWLYTDLLLGLMIVFLGSVTYQVVASSAEQDGSQPGGVAAATTTTSTTTTSTTTTVASTTTSTTTVAPTTTSTTTTTTTLAPTTTSTTVPVGVEQGYYCFRINRTLDIGDPESVQASVSDLRNQLLIAGISQRTAGIVLTFGVHENVGSGGRIAERFNEVALPQIAVFGTAAFRAFGDGGAKTGEWMTSTGKSVSETIKGGVRIDIYLLATVDDEPHPRDEKGDRRCG